MDYLFILINPLKFVEVQKKDIMNAIINGNEEDIKTELLAMGDITIKLLRNGEEKVCLCYLDYFKDIFLEFMKLRSEYPDKYVVSIIGFFEEGDTENNILYYIVNEYFRIYKESLSRNQDTISNGIASNLFEILDVVIHE